MRVTTNSIMNNYVQNLNTILESQAAAGEKVMTHRKFNSGSEDPAATQQASLLHREYLQNKDYMNTIKGEQERVDMALSAMSDIGQKANSILSDSGLSAISGTTSESDRKTFSETFMQIQQSMIQFANTKYKDKYLFGGQHNDTTPFEGSGADVTYLGTNVTTGDMADLDALNGEKVYIDIGLGIRPGMVNDSNAYDTSIPGTSFLGYGQTDDGISKNIIALTGQMGELLKGSDEQWKAGGSERFEAMMAQYKKSYDKVVDSQSKYGVKSNYLETTHDRMEELDTSYNTQILDVEYVNDSEAITDYYYTQYTYNAALRVGSSLLSPSLLDFLK